jgi:hypothetical protein
MSASEVRNTTLSQLRAARTAMLSARWTLSLEEKDQKTQEDAAKEFLRVHHAIQKLENAQLAEIRDALLENEQALAEGSQKLAKALKSLNRTRDVLNATSQLLAIVARVASLLLLPS